MLAMTLALNMPINLAIFRWTKNTATRTVAAATPALDLIHTGRILLDSAGFALSRPPRLVLTRISTQPVNTTFRHQLKVEKLI